MTNFTNTDLFEFYSRLGESTYATQVVEGTLHKCLVIVDFIEQDEHISDDLADNNLEKYRQMTLGKLVKCAKRSDYFSDTLISQLTKFNKERRWVIHRMQEDIGLELRTDADLRSKINIQLDNFSNVGFRLQREIINVLLKEIPKEKLESKKFKEELEKNLKKAGF
jgi:hypothetical protein